MQAMVQRVSASVGSPDDLISIDMYLANVWYQRHLALSYVMTCATYKAVVEMMQGYVGA
jgi:hypothetical protein